MKQAPDKPYYSPLPGFQPTYEELKPIRQLIRKAEEESFQPTYEELKQRRMTDEEMLEKGFQPTYEELKQKCKPSPGSRLHVFSLPMRN